LGLRWDDADLKRGTLRVGRSLVREGGRHTVGETKTRRGRRQINLTPRTVNALKAHRKRQLEEKMRLAESYEDWGLIFSSRVGTPVNPENLVNRSFKPLLKKAGLPKIRFHNVRHTCATLLLGRGVHPKFVQELLGHATIAMTLDTYSHYLPLMGDQAAGTMGDALGWSGNCQVTVKKGRVKLRPFCCDRSLPAKHRFLRVDPTRLELVTSAMRSQYDSLLGVSVVCKTPANKPIF
jgi:integrase